MSSSHLGHLFIYTHMYCTVHLMRLTVISLIVLECLRKKHQMVPLAAMVMTQLKVWQNTKVNSVVSVAALKYSPCLQLWVRYDVVVLLCWYTSEGSLTLTSSATEKVHAVYRMPETTKLKTAEWISITMNQVDGYTAASDLFFVCPNHNTGVVRSGNLVNPSAASVFS